MLDTYVPLTGNEKEIWAVGEDVSGAIDETMKVAYTRLMGKCGTTSSWKGWPGPFATCLEFPQSRIADAPVSGASGTLGKYQPFGNDSTQYGALVASSFGTWGVWGAIFNKWAALGYSASCLGFPVDDEQPSGTNRVSMFERGSITWDSLTDQTAHICGAATETRVIALSGSLAFGYVPVGTSAQRTMTISNVGDAALTVSSIDYPSGFSGNWSGAIAVGESQNVTVTFTPTTVGSYNGTVTVNSDKTDGTNTIGVTASAVPQAPVGTPTLFFSLSPSYPGLAGSPYVAGLAVDSQGRLLVGELFTSVSCGFGICGNRLISVSPRGIVNWDAPKVPINGWPAYSADSWASNAVYDGAADRVVLRGR